MKKTMTIAIVIMAAIIIAASFDLQFLPSPTIQVPETMIGQELYVCPAADRIWDPIAAGVQPFRRFLLMGFFFCALILMFVWGWALYQNLLKDSFKRDMFKTPWAFTKLAFWAGVIVMILVTTPNHFRRIQIDGADGEWVLCENNTPGARAVRASAVHR